MLAYIYQAALLCEECAKNIQLHVQTVNGPDWKNSIPVDSNVYPQGPYADGGGEADSPNHCDHCSLFLENPLTTDGYEYVRETMKRDAAKHPHSFETVALAEWAPFYGISLEEEEEEEPTCDDCSRVLTEQVMINSFSILCEECYAKRTKV